MSWGSSFNKEFNTIKGFRVEAKREVTSDGKVVVIKDDKIIEEDEESNELI